MTGQRRQENQSGRDSGSVTAETAVLLPVVLLILLAIAGVSVVGSAQVRVQQAAGVIAREQASGGCGLDGGSRNGGTVQYRDGAL